MINLSNQSPLLCLPQLRSSPLRFFNHIVESRLCLLFDPFNFPFRNKLQRLVYHDNNKASNVGQGSNLVLGRAHVSTVGPRPSSARAHPHSAYRKRMIRRREVSSLFLIGEVETKLTCINILGFYSAALGARMARAWSGVSWIYAVDETGLVTATAKIKPCANKRCCSQALPTVSPAQTWALLSSVLR